MNEVLSDEDMARVRLLSFQASCMRDLLVHARTPLTYAGAEGGVSTLLWLDRHAELFRMVDQLERARPELTATLRQILTTFPGSQIVSFGRAAG